jgi:hypothetical protein
MSVRTRQAAIVSSKLLSAFTQNISPEVRRQNADAAAARWTTSPLEPTRTAAAIQACK